jgi:DNA processing protein
MINKTAHLVALQQINGLGPVRLKLILNYFSDPQEAWESERRVWEELKVPSKVITNWIENRKNTQPEKLVAQILNQGIKILTIFDSEYPVLLKEIYDPPMVLYYLGDNLDIFKKRMIGVVGTREVTSYGQEVTEKFVGHLVNSNLVIVSGLARGVDTVAHTQTVKQDGLTIAVLGGGINRLYPGENTALSQEIVKKGGLVISEYPPNDSPQPGNFPARNRIISGLSEGVLVTEAAIKSGSLITAKSALEQGREVYAIPGPITSSQSFGVLDLIKQGAKLVTDPEEIVQDIAVS